MIFQTLFQPMELAAGPDAFPGPRVRRGSSAGRRARKIRKLAVQHAGLNGHYRALAALTSGPANSRKDLP